MFRKQILKKHLNVGDIHYVLWHHGSVFLSITIRVLLFLLASYLLYLLLSKYIQWEYLHWIFAFVGLWLFIKYVYDFLGMYLDGIILSGDGISLFMWQWLADYKVDFFERSKIETVSYSQNSIWDKMFVRWDISIKLHEIEYPFENVSFPKQQVDRILKMKMVHDKKVDEDLSSDTDIDSEKVSILADALWEVIKEYMQKNTKEKDSSDWF